MYAIQNKQTLKWVYGTDFTRNPYTQRTSFDRALTFATYEDAEIEYKRRMCGKTYEIVVVRLERLY